ncbi:MAG: hypothetical protein JWM93_2663, partial [Frankiales bacterium]|nr:hypothetical protein [Frankiales bacterium]
AVPRAPMTVQFLERQDDATVGRGSAGNES